MRGRKKKKEPPLPADRESTVRQEIMSALRDGPLSVRDLSVTVRASERDVHEHLEHIRKSACSQGAALKVVPSQCRKCGFSFRKRERLAKPGKCPICKAESISEPLYSIR